MLRCCCRGLAAVVLAAGMCLPALADEQSSATRREFTPAEHLMHHIIASHFGLTHEQVMDLNARGYSYEDIATAANVAARSGRSLSDIVAIRDRQMSWDDIASQGGVPVADVDLAMSDLETPTYRVAAERETIRTSAVTPGPSRYAMPVTEIDWSRRYELTPLEFKRLRAMGLSDREIFVAANAAELSARPVDDFVQMIFRGMTSDQIAQELNVDVSRLEEAKAVWKTPEWQEAVRAGQWTMPTTVTEEREGRRNRGRHEGRMRGEMEGHEGGMQSEHTEHARY